MVYYSSRVTENRTQLNLFLSDYSVLELDARAAEEFGVIRAELRRAGRPIPVIDILIAAIARTRKLILLTSDNHFEAVQALDRENWLAQ